MMRTLIVLVVLAGVAHADTASEAKSVTDDAMARWNAADDDRGVLMKLWTLIDSTAYDNMTRAKEQVLDRKKDIDKRLKNHEDVDAELRLTDLKRDVKQMDHEIDEYRSTMKATEWKLGGGILLFVIAAFGATIWRFVRRRR